MPDQSVSPLILAIDTTSELGSLALLRGAEVVEEVPMHAPRGFGDVLYAGLRGLLDRHRLDVREVDCFAAASGPGSFTGVRVGLACVKGLAEAVGRPAAGIPNLQAISCFGGGPLRAAVVDARRGEIYGAVYDSGARIVLPEVVAKIGEWLETLPDGVEFVTGECSMVREAVRGTRFEGARIVAAPRTLAGAIGRLAGEKLKSGENLDPAALDANYVRRSDAELFWRE